MAKILLIEDDLALAEFLRQSLEGKLHEVDHVCDGSTGLSWLQHEHYAAAIVDWQLPGLSGPEICRKFRQLGGATPILMITGKDTDPDVVDGLDAGADDYLPKPFDLSVMHARLKALLRSPAPVASEILQVGTIELNPSSGLVRAGGNAVKLTRREFNILELFMRNPDHLFSAETIVERVWPSDSESSPETVRSHINRLRKNLSLASPDSGDCIESVYGLGYKMRTGSS